MNTLAKCQTQYENAEPPETSVILPCGCYAEDCGCYLENLSINDVMDQIDADIAGYAQRQKNYKRDEGASSVFYSGQINALENLREKLATTSIEREMEKVS